MRRLQRHRQADGFTLVELLVVVLIIAILAAVAIPMYLGQQDKAKDSAVKDALQTVQTNLSDSIQKNNGVLDYDSEKEAVTTSGYKIDLNQFTDGTEQTPTYSTGDIVIGVNNGATTEQYVIHACMVQSGLKTYHCFHTDQSGKITSGWQ